MLFVKLHFHWKLRRIDVADIREGSAKGVCYSVTNKAGRGDRREFEPCPQNVAAYLSPFAGRSEPLTTIAERLIGLSA